MLTAASLAQSRSWLDRIHLIESEYSLAVLKAELSWVREVLHDLHSDRFKWDLRKILKEVRAARRKESARKEKSV